MEFPSNLSGSLSETVNLTSETLVSETDSPTLVDNKVEETLKVQLEDGLKTLEGMDFISPLPLSVRIGESHFNINSVSSAQDLESAREVNIPDTPTLSLVAIESPAKFQSPKPRKRGARGANQKLGKVEGADLPEWLPQGWEMERKARQSGGSAGMVDTFYYDPDKGRQFRSKSEVLQFLDTGMRRSRPKKSKKNLSNISSSSNSEPYRQNGASWNKKKRRTATKIDTNNHPQLVSWVINIDADGSGSLNPVIVDATVPEKTILDSDAAFTHTEVGTSSPKVDVE